MSEGMQEVLFYGLYLSKGHVFHTLLTCAGEGAFKMNLTKWEVLVVKRSGYTSFCRKCAKDLHELTEEDVREGS